jgi:hypothetical protein
MTLISRVLLLISLLGAFPPSSAAERELTPAELERVIFTVDATRHHLPPLSRWVQPDSQALLLGFTHVMNSVVPAELEGLLPELRITGVTDLILETPEGSQDCFEFLAIAVGHLPSAEFLAKWEVVYGPEYYSLLRAAEMAGIRVGCGDRPEVPKEHLSSEELFQLRNEFIAWNLTRMIEEGRKPLLLIGAYHVNPVHELMGWLEMNRTGATPRLGVFHASELDGRYAPSEGLLYPDIGQMLHALGREVFFRAKAVDRRPEQGFGPRAASCLSCPESP